MKSIVACLCAVIMSTVIFLTGWDMAHGAPTIAGCPIFPADNVWNTPIDYLPLDPNSSAYITSIGAATGLHPDFGTIWEGAPIGIPYNIVPGTQPQVSITFGYNDESDHGPYPIPPDADIEGGDASTGDRHILVLDEDNCILYETFYSWPQEDGSWQAGSGAVYDLHSNALRPSGWTSADAAGLPILPGLVRYDEVASGEITHALRFTVQHTRKAFIWPARHYASSLTSTNYPPMGQRFRLKASFDISGFSPEVQVIIRALKKYGMILADNGSNWYISGVPDYRWNDDTLVGELKLVKGSDFEAVDESSLMVDLDSGQVNSTTTVQLTTTVSPTTTTTTKPPTTTTSVPPTITTTTTGIVTTTTAPVSRTTTTTSDITTSTAVSSTTTTIEPECTLTVEKSFLRLRAGLFARLCRIVIKGENSEWNKTSQVTIDDINTIIQRVKDQETIIAWIIIPGKLIAKFEPGAKEVRVQTPGKEDCTGEMVIE